MFRRHIERFTTASDLRELHSGTARDPVASFEHVAALPSVLTTADERRIW
jgi:hypothetical protein